MLLLLLLSSSAEHVELCTCMKLQGSRGSPSRYGWIRQAVELLCGSKRAKRASQHQGLISTFADSASDVHQRRTSKRKQGLPTAADEMRLHFTALDINFPPLRESRLQDPYFLCSMH